MFGGYGSCTRLVHGGYITSLNSCQVYPSNKPLAAWTRDLVLRVEQFAKWATTAHQPTIFWMSGFTFPTGFLTAVLQTCARQNNISVDSLSWEFVVSTVDDSNITQQPKVSMKHSLRNTKYFTPSPDHTTDFTPHVGSYTTHQIPSQETLA